MKQQTNEQKVVVVTGASSGIGLATVKALLEDGWQVVATVRNPNDIEQLKTLGVHALTLDLRDDQSIQDCANTIIDQYGDLLYGIFNNAGFGLQCAVEDVTPEHFREQLQVNVVGQVDFTNRLLPALMVKDRARLIFNSSVMGYYTLPFRGPYSASKFALEALCDALRIELVGTNVSVTLIEPGPIEARFRHNALSYLTEVIDCSHTRLDYTEHMNRLSAPTSTTKGSLPASYVAKIVCSALSAKNPRPRYRVTRSAKISWWFKKFLPTVLIDSISKRVQPVIIASRL